MTPTVYLIPTFLDERALAPLPGYIVDAVKTCTVFFVENERSARRYLKMLWKEMVIDQYEWHAIDKIEAETSAGSSFRAALARGAAIGIISEAGCPGIADPGQILTAIARKPAPPSVRSWAPAPSSSPSWPAVSTASSSGSMGISPSTTPAVPLPSETSKPNPRGFTARSSLSKLPTATIN